MMKMRLSDRNEPVHLTPCNPLPMNKMDAETGDAGKDGYTILSKASRMTDLRPPAGGRLKFGEPVQLTVQNISPVATNNPLSD